MKVCVIGLGYIGLPTAAMFANAGYDVLGVDKKPQIVEALNRGEIIIEENGLPEYIKAVVEKATCAPRWSRKHPTPISFPFRRPSRRTRRRICASWKAQPAASSPC